MIIETVKDIYRNLIENLPVAFARHQVLLDDSGTPVDYLFLEINSAFEEMTGLKRKEIIGKKVTEVLPGIENKGFDWIGTYGKVALSGESTRFENFSQPLDRWYEVQAYSNEPGYFTTIFYEVTERKEKMVTVHSLLELTEDLIGSELATFDYQASASSLLKLSGAKFAAINTYEHECSKTVTRAIAGISSDIRRASELLGVKITGHSWDIIPERIRQIRGSRLINYKSIFDSSMGKISKTQSDLLHKLFDIGEIYVIELAYGGRESMGDIIFFMPQGKDIQNRETIELYASQLGMFLERKKAEKAVRESEETLKTITENMTDMVSKTDAAGNFVYVSASSHRVLGYEPKDLLGKSVFEFVHQEDLPEILTKFNHALATGENSNAEYRIKAKDGSYFWVETIGTLLFEDNQISGAIFTTREITERKLAEEALRKSEHELKTVTENMTDIVAMSDVEGRFTYLSESNYHLLGYRPAELLGKSILELIHRDDLSKTGDLFQEGISGDRKSAKVEYRVRKKEGGYIWVETIGSLLLDDKEQPSGALFTSRDISDRKLAEEALKESENKYRQIADNTSDVIWTADLNLNLTYVSPSVEKILGESVDEHLKKNMDQKFTPQSLEHIIAVLQEELEKEIDPLADKDRTRIVEVESYRSDGKTIWLSMHISGLRDEAGKITGFQGVSRDISERKQVEEALRLQASERAAVDAFTYSVSHDLQAPLRRIEGFSEALLDECNEQLNDQARDYLKRIDRQIGSMKEQTNALLKLSRVVSHDITFEVVNLSAMVRSHLDSLRYHDPDRRIETIVAPNMEAKGDVDLLNIALENLIDNAWKFTAGEKQSRIECGFVEQNRSTVYFVRDNGIGFDQQHADKLFEPFQKLHREAEYPGIGIGLNIVYRIITRHGGKIWAEGNPGNGACFCFTLP